MDTKGASDGSAVDTSPLVVYIVLRKDLGWPVGATASQAAHAVLAAVWTYKDHPDTIAYGTDLENMRQVLLECPTEHALLSLAETLEKQGIDHKVWIEQPENVKVALATRPYRKSVIGHFFKALKLFK